MSNQYKLTKKERHWNDMPLDPVHLKDRQTTEVSSMNYRHISNIRLALSKEPDYYCSEITVENGIFWLTIYLKTNEELYGNNE
jgi:hypothetical protein